MKNKVVLFVLLLLSFLCFNNRVSAVTLKYNYYDDDLSSNFRGFEVISDFAQTEEVTNVINTLKNYWEENLKDDYRYYYIYIYNSYATRHKEIHLYYSRTDSYVSFLDDKSSSTDLYLATRLYRLDSKDNDLYYYKKISASYIGGDSSNYYYDYDDSTTYSYISYSGRSNVLSDYYYYLYDTNGRLYFERPINSVIGDHYYDSIYFYPYSSDKFSKEEFTVKMSEELPSMKGLLDGSYRVGVSNLTEIDLNSYEYVVLVPNYDKIKKDFNLINMTDSAVFNHYYVGTYCPTAVFNYGRTINSDNTENCRVNSRFYDDEDGVNDIDKVSSDLSINLSSLTNKVVFYIEPKYRSKKNFYYYDSNYFDVVYVTNSKVCPTVHADDSDYQALCLSDIPNTSKYNDENGIIGGAVEEFSLRNLWHRISSSFNNFISNMTNSIKSLFIPSDGFFKDWFNDIHTFLSIKLGILYYPVDVVIDFFNRILNISTSSLGVINIPDIKEPFFNHVIISAQTINLKEIFSTGNLGRVHSIYLTLVDFIIYIALANMCFSKFAEILGRYSNDYEDVIDDNYIPEHSYEYKAKHSRTRKDYVSRGGSR